MAELTLSRAAQLSQGGDGPPLYAVVALGGGGSADQGRASARSALEDLKGMQFPVGDADHADALMEVLEEAAQSRMVPGWPDRYGILTLGFVDVSVVHVRAVEAKGEADSTLRDLVLAGAEPEEVEIEELASETDFPILIGVHHRVLRPDDQTERLVLLVFAATRQARPDGPVDVVAFSLSDDASAVLRTIPAQGGLVASASISPALA